MKFVEPDKAGTVLGNAVKARPIPIAKFQAALDKIKALTEAGDDSGVMGVVASIVREYVTMADGSTIDPDELSPSAIKELYSFVIDFKAEGVADFTASP